MKQSRFKQRGSIILTTFGVSPGGGATPTVSLNTTDVVKASVIGTTYANLRYSSTGEEFENSGRTDNFSTSRGNWLDSGNNSDVWLERTINSGSLDTDPGSGRLIMSTTRDFKVVDSDSGGSDVVCNLDIEMWDAASGGSVIDSVLGLEMRAAYTDICPTCCFTPDTPITLADGTFMAIGDIRQGDLIKVLGGVEPVSEIIVRDNRPMYRVTFDDDRVLEISDEHPIAIAGKGYAAINPVDEYKDLGRAEYLTIGDRAVDSDRNLIAVISIYEFHYPDAVYTFGNSKFYANGILVY